jgi:translation initiation factor IF-3
MGAETNNLCLRSISISKPVRINGAIKANELRVIGPDGEQIGILTRAEALLEAERQDLDLVEISPTANPPVVRIVDWGKYNYQKTKEMQRNRKHAKATELKQMRLGLKIGSNDLEIKLRKIRSFLEQGHKVKIMVFFRGREMAHQEIGYQLLDRIIQSLSEVAVVDQTPQLAGKNLSIVVRSNVTNVKVQAKDPSRDS